MHYVVRRQISVSLENQPGALSRATGILAREGVNILGLSIVDNIEQGVVRLHVDEPGAARAALEAAGLQVIEADVFEVDLVDAPGRLAQVCAALAEGGVNIEYAYGTVKHGPEPMHLLLKAAPAARAAAILRDLAAE